MELTRSAPPPEVDGGHSHLVEFYDTDAFLVDTVCAFLAPSMRDGNAAIVIATDAHRLEFESALADYGIQIDEAGRDGHYLAVDAASLLSRLMVEGKPDATRFSDTIGAVLDRASQGGREIRVYHELVALLIDDGAAASALTLEDLWNDLTGMRSFVLMCGYPMWMFAQPTSDGTFARICEQHTTVILSEGPSSPDADPAMQTPPPRSDAPSQQVGPGPRRDSAALYRDRAADQRDHAAEDRDHLADERDHAADVRDRALERSATSASVGITTYFMHPSTIARRASARDRERASLDRKAGAEERVHAQLDRDAALADRRASVREREYSSHDDLTGVYHRGAGLVELAREIARARRTQRPLVLAFVDVDRLKVINDSRGHAAGDRMLREVADAIKQNLRAHDLIIRYGGDEFVCSISGMTIADATARVALVNAALADSSEHGSVTMGLAELQPGDSPQDLVARADAALYRARRRQRHIRA